MSSKQKISEQPNLPLDFPDTVIGSIVFGLSMIYPNLLPGKLLIQVREFCFLFTIMIRGLYIWQERVTEMLGMHKCAKLDFLCVSKFCYIIWWNINWHTNEFILICILDIMKQLMMMRNLMFSICLNSSLALPRGDLECYQREVAILPSVKYFDFTNCMQPGILLNQFPWYIAQANFSVMYYLIDIVPKMLILN